MIEEDVKQTRCTTCDAEHAYKGARVPARRKKETPAALYKEVLAGMPEADEAPLLAAAAAPAHASLPAVPVAPRLYPSRRNPSPAARSTTRSLRSKTVRAWSPRRSMPREEVRAEADFRRRRGSGRRWSGAPAADSRHAAPCGRAEGSAARARLHHQAHALPRRWQRPRRVPGRPRSHAHARRRQWERQRQFPRPGATATDPTAVPVSRETAGRAAGARRWVAQVVLRRASVATATEEWERQQEGTRLPRVANSQPLRPSPSARSNSSRLFTPISPFQPSPVRSCGHVSSRIWTSGLVRESELPMTRIKGVRHD